jgi:MFS family permease
LIVLLGVWGGLLPFIGPSFDYAYTPDQSWHWTAGRFWMQLLPGIAAVVGGLILSASRSRVSATFGGWLAVAAGGWYVVGPLLSPLWDNDFIGQPIGDETDRAVEQIGLFFGLGAVIILLGAFALGRLAVIGARDAEVGERYASERRERAAARHEAKAAHREPEPVITDESEPRREVVVDEPRANERT